MCEGVCGGVDLYNDWRDTRILVHQLTVKESRVYCVSTCSKWGDKQCRDKTRMRARVLFKGSSELWQLLNRLVDPHTVLGVQVWW